jgi:predicted amidohydrolase
VQKVIDKVHHDPVLTTQLANGLALERVIPDDFPVDSDSRGQATFLEWTRLDHLHDPGRRLQRVSMVRICAGQYQMRTIQGFEDFAARCECSIDTASEYKSGLVLFPELLTAQILSFLPSKSPADAVRKLAESTPKYLGRFTDLAIKYKVNIVGGSRFPIEGEDVRSLACLFRRDGTLERQYKLHITPSERHWWDVQPGSEPGVLTTDPGKIAIRICYDIEFPELARIAAGQGARIFFVSFNPDNRDGFLRIRYDSRGEEREV